MSLKCETKYDPGSYLERNSTPSKKKTILLFALLFPRYRVTKNNLEIKCETNYDPGIESGAKFYPFFKKNNPIFPLFAETWRPLPVGWSNYSREQTKLVAEECQSANKN